MEGFDLSRLKYSVFYMHAKRSTLTIVMDFVSEETDSAGSFV